MATQQQGNVTIVTFPDKDSLLDDSFDAVQQEMVACIQNGSRRMIVDLTGVRYATSRPIGAFVRVQNEMNQRQGTFVLCGVGLDLGEVFRPIQDKNFTFRIYATQQDAMDRAFAA